MIDWIREKVIVSGKLLPERSKRSWFVKNNHESQYDEIINKTSFLKDPTFAQRIWHVYHNQPFLSKCCNPKCEKIPKFFSFSKGYLRTCSSTCAQHDPQTINKIKSTNIKKYGVEYGLSNKEIKEKINKTVKEKYGVDNISQLKEISEKKVKTCFENYGVNWILSDQKRKEKDIYKKYGVKNVRNLKSVNDKISTTRRSGFYDYLFVSDRLKGKVLPLFTKEEYINGGYYSDYKFKCCKCNVEFLDCLEDGDIPRCNVCYKNSSLFEKEIVDFVRTLLVSEVIEENNKKILNGYEIDVYIPSKKIAIECNGLFWHGEINGLKDKNYHLNKTKECLDRGIRLIHIFEDEWLFNKEIVKNRLKYILGCETNKIYARNCNVRIIDSKKCCDFLEKYHIQGKDSSSIKLGLFLEEELVSTMTFGNMRTCLGNKNNNSEYELYRFCNKNISVVGGFSKLLNFFIKTYNPSKIISYVDRRWNDGKSYETVGFRFVKSTSPNYWYFGKNKNYKRYHRFNFAKHTLKNKLSNFDNNLTEWENMKNNGWDRIWDCGNIKYELLYK